MPTPPKGLRILYCGDSWHRFMPDYAARTAKADLQMAWIVHDGLANRVTAKQDYDNSKVEEVQAILDRERVKVEAAADKLNEKYGRTFFFLVPLGDATTKLRGMIVEGKIPGVTKQSDIFADAMPHAGPIAAELAAYCNCAAIYRQSPVGLRIENGVPDEQRVILQTLAWETVSKYQYAGVDPTP